LREIKKREIDIYREKGEIERRREKKKEREKERPNLTNLQILISLNEQVSNPRNSFFVIDSPDK
jgi:hypothetical protein